ncbi:uncharacterized protein M6B38_157520 [Iris pallida]|uniref:Uncharacterized protein n=1 Tax=Iris pallida TaxID=29817 RepID=A0AAX6F1J3_IRIPA|nr:uncharacterized protein M6B38_157520 [Iris pallida]
MEGETKGKKELQSVIEAINSSDDLESRISLISQIGDTYLIDPSDLAHLIDCLITCWEDSTCFGIFQCMLNKTILDVAAKYLELDMSNCLSQFLILATKASMWGRKHLQDSQDENISNLFSQLLLGTLNFGTTTITSLARSSILGDKVLMLIVESFIFELLNLTKDLIFELKSHLIASELLKASQVVLDAAVKLCRAYSQNSKWDSLVMNSSNNDGSSVNGDVHFASHIVSITGCIIESLYELGIFAAAGGGNLVAVLNVSWKGIVSLLHLGKGLGKGLLSEKVNVGDIILTLVSLATESLKCAGEAWSSTIKEALASSEAKRTFLPIKFYLINAVRISLDYPCKAVNLYREISQCVLLISSLGSFLSKETHLRAASEVLVEFLEPTSFHLLCALLNSADLNFESRFLILEWLFTNEMDSSSKDLMKDVNYSTQLSSFDGISCLNCNSMPKNRVLLLGRVLLFMNLLKSSADLKDEMVLAISKKLDYLLDTLVHGDVYSTTLGQQIPVLSPGSVPGVTWEPLFSCIVQSLKTFMVVASSNELAWFEVETFLFQNIIHSHFLCVEIVTELWSFVMRHAEKEMINHILESLCLLFKTIASLEPALTPHSSLRKIARSICNLLTWSPIMVVDHVYTSILSDELMIVALLMEGFPFGSLSDDVKKVVVQKIVAACYDFIGSNYKELVLYGSSGSCTNDLIGLPVQAISSALRTCNMKSSVIIDEKLGSQVLKFTLTLVHGYKNARDGVKECYAMLLGAALLIISTTEHLYASDKMAELILEFQTLFAIGPSDADTALCRFKPSFASFLASLGHMEIPDGEGSVLCPAVCTLYHVLLRERHWAFIHLAIGAFGSFAACTTCTQLWRFVPDDAALSFDTSSGKEANEDRFMSELKAFLDKSIALKDAYLGEEQLSHLVKEGLVLNELCKLPNAVADDSATEVGETVDDGCVKKKKRKLDGVCEGIEMLQSGLKAMSNALAEADADELKEAFSPYMSSLKDVISHLVSLSG